MRDKLETALLAFCSFGIMLLAPFLILIILPFAYKEYREEKRKMGDNFPYRSFGEWFEDKIEDIEGFEP